MTNPTSVSSTRPAHAVALTGGFERSFAIVSTVEQSPGEVRRLGRLSWIAFLGGSCLLGLAVLTSMVRLVPDLLSTVAAILGVASMFSGLVMGVLIVLQRDRDE
jgi:uncharacterized membrane protein YdcZ (DUF606 family)